MIDSPTDPSIVATIASLNSIGQGLSVEFWRTNDRYGHRILLVLAPDCREVVLESIEGSSETLLEGVPAFQDLNLKNFPHGSTAFLVGASDNCHWSLVVESRGAESTLVDAFAKSRCPTIHFDAACRRKRSPLTLESRYRLHPNYQFARQHDASGKLTSPFGSLSITPYAPSETSLSAVLRPNGREIAIALAPSDATTQPATLRWRYQLTFQGATP